MLYKYFKEINRINVKTAGKNKLIRKMTAQQYLRKNVLIGQQLGYTYINRMSHSDIGLLLLSK